MSPDKLLELLSPKVVVFRRDLVPVAGSVHAALMLSQALYEQRRAGPGAWWLHTVSDWEEHLGLMRRAQENARAKLVERSLLSVKREPHGSGLMFRVDTERVANCLGIPNGSSVPTSAPSVQGCAHHPSVPSTSLRRREMEEGTHHPSVPQVTGAGAAQWIVENYPHGVFLESGQPHQPPHPERVDVVLLENFRRFGDRPEDAVRGLANFAKATPRGGRFTRLLLNWLRDREYLDWQEPASAPSPVDRRKRIEEAERRHQNRVSESNRVRLEEVKRRYGIHVHGEASANALDSTISRDAGNQSREHDRPAQGL